MDPNASLANWAAVVMALEKVSKTRQGATHYHLMDSAIESASNLKEWLERGGFEPKWTPKEKKSFLCMVQET